MLRFLCFRYQVSGLGAGVDSYYEILLKSFIMFGEAQVDKNSIMIIVMFMLKKISSGCWNVSCLLWKDKAVHAAWQVRKLTKVTCCKGSFFPGLNATPVPASTLCMWTLRWALATQPPIGSTVFRLLFQGSRFTWKNWIWLKPFVFRCFMATSKKQFVTMLSITLFGKNMAVFQRGNCREGAK